MDSDMSVYKNDFLQEVYECLDVFNQAFVNLEKGDNDAINEIFRIAHTIKGMAGFLNYKSLEKLCHNMEGVLCGIKDGEIKIDSELVDTMLSTVDRITEMVKQIESQDSDNIEIDDLLKAFENYQKSECRHESLMQEPVEKEPMENEPIEKESVEKESVEKEPIEKEPIEKESIEKESIENEPLEQELVETEEIKQAEIGEESNASLEENPSLNLESPEKQEANDLCTAEEDYNLVLDVTLSEDCMMKDLRASLILESLRDICKVFKTSPSEDEMEKNFDGNFTVFVLGNEEQVENLMDRISEIEYFNIKLRSAANETLMEKVDSTENGSNNINVLLLTLLNLITKIQIILNKLNKKAFQNEEYATATSELPKDTFIENTLLEENIAEESTIEPSIAEKKIAEHPQPENLGLKEQNSEEKNLEKVQLEESKLEESKLEELNPENSSHEDDSQEKAQEKELTPDEPQSLETPEKLQTEHSLKQTEIDHSQFELKREETIRVRTSNLDNIMNLVGELVINKGRLFQISQEYDIPELEEASSALDKSISSLQDEVMRIRMIKIERVFSKFPRMVRDLSRKFGKSINFEIEGQETELDRTILDEINDPLVHLVRNAVDHGIEAPEERKQAGKSETGNIKLSARREKNNVIIEIEDDGKGMNLELIKKKALEKGIISAFDLENLNEEEIRMLIFTPGFSTKDAATEISGRGVGMDVVKNTVEKLGGKVRIYSKAGEYTKIQIDLPPTVAIIKSLLVEVEKETYAIPISNVVKALSVEKGDYKFIKESPLLYMRDKLIPVVKLREIFKLPHDKLEKELAIIVEKDSEEIGLIVDSIINQQEIVIKPLGNIFSNLKGFIGVTILGDGRIIPIIDVSLLIKGDIDD